jgi:hypothetical protein
MKCENLAKIDVIENNRVSPIADGQGRENKKREKIEAKFT